MSPCTRRRQSEPSQEKSQGAVISKVDISSKLVIAHRGACGYLPEHTLPAKVLAHAQGADYLEQDVVMTRDDHLLVMHDLFLDRMTDVAQRFPGRQRADGHFYVIDFDWAELRELQVSEPMHAPPRDNEPWYPGRFPPRRSRFGLHTLREEIELIQGLNATTGRQVGIYPEIKGPWFHVQEGKDLSLALLHVLKAHGYTGRDSPVYLQTFDYEELVRLREELLPALNMDIKLIQLIPSGLSGETYRRTVIGELAELYDYRWMNSAAGMRELALHADGVGPSHTLVIEPDSAPEQPQLTALVHHAHEAGLAVHPYTFRRDRGQVPPYAADYEDWLRLFYWEAGVDGLFTDFPDLAVGFLSSWGGAADPGRGFRT